MAALVHASACVDPSAVIGENVSIGPYSIVGPRVTIGARTRLMHHVSVMENTVLGEENLAFPGAVLGADPQDKKFVGEETWLHVGDRNTFREHVTINRGTGLGGGETRIGDECLIMAGSHVAHDCILGNRITIANNVLLGGHIVVDDGVGFGGFTAVHHFVSIGCYAFIGGMTRVVADAPPFMITEGYPARVRAINRVGLKRNGLSESAIAWLKEACRLLYGEEGVNREEVLARLKANGPVPGEGEILIEFLGYSLKGKQGRQRQP